MTLFWALGAALAALVLVLLLRPLLFARRGAGVSRDQRRGPPRRLGAGPAPSSHRSTPSASTSDM